MSESHFAPLLAAGSNAALATFLLYTLAVFVLAGFSNRLLQKKSFLSEYFLGSRSLGVWAFALTFAATSASGGSFTGFPAKIYTHGWILALWIGSYMVVPICAMGLLGKRINQVARVSGAITVPDILRDRFNSPAFGLVSVSLIVFFMSFNLVAQFKSGALILKTLLEDVTLFQDASVRLAAWGQGASWLVDPQYLLCLFGFGVAVIVYTTYGGFHAVVWTDVMQGVVMVVGVLIMLPLALWQVGGMETATLKMIDMVPPRFVSAELIWDRSEPELVIPAESWLRVDGEGTAGPRLFKVAQPLRFTAEAPRLEGLRLLEIVTEGDRQRVLDAENTSWIPPSVTLGAVTQLPYKYGAEPGRKGVYVTGPGPSSDDAHGFLPLALAVSFFFMWAISGAGQPSSMVRLMAFRNSLTLRRAIFTVAIYYSLIYFPLVVIFCIARVLMPGMETEPDRIMPVMAVYLTAAAKAPWLAGLLVAAPFAAVMSTVDSFLLMISSAVVRDIYQRNLNPNATERSIKMLSYLVTLLVGTAAMIGAISPPRFLQDIIVYVGSGLAACFLAPMVLNLYYPRSNLAGCMSAMLGGFAAHLAMYVTGYVAHGKFAPYRLFSLDPIIVGLVVSFVLGLLVTHLTPPPPAETVRRYFGRA